MTMGAQHFFRTEEVGMGVFRVKRCAINGEWMHTSLAGEVRSIGTGFIAYPAFMVRCGQPLIGDPIQAVFTSLADAATVLL